jgi:hypothetical protein
MRRWRGAWLLFLLSAASAQAHSCPADGPLFPAPAAFEDSDPGRTRDFRCATFGGARDGANVVTARRLYGGGFLPQAVLAGQDRLVLAGAPQPESDSAGGLIGLDARGDVVWRRPFSTETRAPHPALHANGHLYAAARGELLKLSAATGAIVKSARIAAAEDAAVDINVLSDGRLIVKSAGIAPCEGSVLDQARCFAGWTSQASTLSVIDPDSLGIVATIVAPERTAGVTATPFGGIDRLYLVGARNIFRYNWDGERLSPDEQWGPVRYILPNQTGAVAAAALGDWIILQTNGAPSKTAMSIVAVHQGDGRLVRHQPFENVPPWNFTLGSKSFSPFSLSVDAAGSRVYITDSGYGLAAGYAFNPKSGKMRLLWMKKHRTMNPASLVGEGDDRAWVAADIGGPCLFMRCLKRHPRQTLVFRDPETGALLARSRPLPPLADGVAVVPGESGKLYYPSASAGLFEIDVEPAR